MSKTQSRFGATIVNNCNCNCWAQINYEILGTGNLELYTENCTGGVISWQLFDTDNRTWTTFQTGGNTVTDIDDTYIRVKITKSGCCDVYSNVTYTYSP